jgi:hypothetical protein
VLEHIDAVVFQVRALLPGELGCALKDSDRRVRVPVRLTDETDEGVGCRASQLQPRLALDI